MGLHEHVGEGGWKAVLETDISGCRRGKLPRRLWLLPCSSVELEADYQSNGSPAITHK